HSSSSVRDMNGNQGETAADSVFPSTSCRMLRTPAVVTVALIALATATASCQSRDSARAALIARAKSFELNTPYVPPPGDPAAHNASGFAKVMCSAVFITGLDPDFAAENVGYFTSPYAERKNATKPVIDRAKKEVRVALPNGVVRTAKYYGDQGCVTLPIGADSVSFTPRRVQSVLSAGNPWPMGDVLPTTPLPHEIDTAKVRQAVDAAFENPAEM